LPLTETDKEFITYTHILTKGNMDMQGWTEGEIRTRDLMAPCGLYCGTCGVYIATRDSNEKFSAIMASLYGTKPEETGGFGCMQPDPPKKRYALCNVCGIMYAE